MLGMANYFAKQKIYHLIFKSAVKKIYLKFIILILLNGISIRKTAMEKADDGTEFINIGY